jgi:polyphosphate kinase
VPGLSESIQLFGLVGRFLDHSRIYRFENGGEPEYFIGSADWMKRNLENRVETIVPLLDPGTRAQIDRVIAIYDLDNSTVWDCRPDGQYVRRRPQEGEPARAAQEMLSREAAGEVGAHLDPQELVSLAARC